MNQHPAAGRTNLRVQLARYGIVGLANTAVGLGTILALQELAGLHPYLSNAIGFGAGLLVSFLLNRAWTFGTRDRAVHRALRFVLSFGVAYGANLATLALLIRPAGAVAAQVSAIAVYTAVFFVLCRWFVFAPSPRARPADGVRPDRSSRP